MHVRIESFLNSIPDSKGTDGVPQLTPSPTAVAVKTESLTLTCTDSDPVVRMFWRKNGIKFSQIKPNCNILGTSTIDSSLYNYSCISDREYTWTILSVTKQQHGDNWTCLVADRTGFFVGSQATMIYIRGMFLLYKLSLLQCLNMVENIIFLMQK